MISLKRRMELVCLALPIALLSSPAWAHCGKCHEKHESACGNPCHKVARCGSPCEHVSRCETKCEKPERVRCAKADLERLHGCMPCDSQELTVNYKVETEHAADGQFDLVVDVIDNGARVEQFVIPLDNARKVEHDGDREYQATVTQTLSNSYTDRHNFRIEGNVIPRNGSGSMDHKTASIHTPGDHGIVYETASFVTYPGRMVTEAIEE